MSKILFSSFFLALLNLSDISYANPTSAPEIITSAKEENLLDDKIYFFAHSMSNSSKEAYIYLYQKYKDLQIPIVDMKDHHNFELYKQCVKKFNIPYQELTLPLFCLKNSYVMGWTHQSPAQLDNAIQKHLSTSK